MNLRPETGKYIDRKGRIEMILAIDKGECSRKYVNAARDMKVDYKLVDCTSSDIMKQLEKVDALIYHWTQDSYIDKRVAFHIIRSAELMGKKVYPNSNTCWMFDDKIAEKYLLEAAGAPCVESKVFFNKISASKWISRQKYPFVYKLPQGAGSSNVRLIKNKRDALRICKSHFSFWGRPDIGMKLYYSEKSMYGKTLQQIYQSNLFRYVTNNRGYILFQKFAPDNKYDIRVTIIGERSIIFRRMVRDNDFRASGSGKIDYNVSERDLLAIPIARKISEFVNSQTMAYDFIYDNGELRIVEMSYGFVAKAVYDAPGWYDEKMVFHPEKTDAYKMVIEKLIEQ